VQLHGQPGDGVEDRSTVSVVSWVLVGWLAPKPLGQQTSCKNDNPP